jgi:hypothetical protein
MLMSLVHVLVRDAVRMRSPELTPPRPSALPCCASSPLPDSTRTDALHRSCAPPASPLCFPHAKSCSVDRIRASSSERRFSAAARRVATAARTLACMRSRPI